MTLPLILCEISANVAEITFNRPEKINSFNTAMSHELIEALHSVSKDSAVRAVLIIANGRGFCAGQDLAEFDCNNQNSWPELGSVIEKTYNPIVLALRTMEKPVVAAVHGVAAGAGANLALACDIVLAAHDAFFIQAFSKIGLIPDCGGSFILPRLVGMARATALTILAEKVTGEEAVRMGMIYKSVPSPELLSAAKGLVQQLASMPTKGLWYTKQLLNQSFSNSLEQQLELEKKAQTAAGKTEDFVEGLKAFVEKRVPKFLGQ